MRIVVTERERWVAQGNGDLVLDVAAKRFEFTYDMAWKALKRVLDYLGIDVRRALCSRKPLPKGYLERKKFGSI